MRNFCQISLAGRCCENRRQPPQIVIIAEVAKKENRQQFAGGLNNQAVGNRCGAS